MEDIVKHLSLTRSVTSIATLLALSFTSASYAQEVTLSSQDGLFSASGELVSFEDGIYTIKTTLGNMQVASNNVSCAGDGCPSLIPEVEEIPIDLRFAGSDIVGGGLMPLLISGYAASFNASIESLPATDGTDILELIADEGYGEPIGTFQVAASNTSAGFAELLAKESTIGMASRRIFRDEARALAQDGAGSMIALEQEHIVAVDSLVVVVNPSNPVKAISIADLASIYRGELTNWSQVGGPDLPLVAYSRLTKAFSAHFSLSRSLGLLATKKACPRKLAVILGLSGLLAMRLSTMPSRCL